MNRYWVVFVSALGLASTLGAGLNWEPGDGFRRARVEVASQGRAGFTLMPGDQTGVWFTNALPWHRFRTNQMLLNGSGVAAGDVDGDGWCDLFFCGLDGPNALYRNLGNWKFQEITDPSGVACPGVDATAAALADLDGDGDMDLVINSMGHGTRILLNDGRARFAELRGASALNPGKSGMSLAIGDLDGDGLPDIYIANYRTSALMDMPNTRIQFKTVNGKREVASVNGRPVTDPDLANRYVVTEAGGIDEQGEADVWLRNLGGGRFEEKPVAGSMFLDEEGHPLAQPQYDWGLSVMIRDLNQDGLPDIYVCNDFGSPDRYWIGQGGGRYRLLPKMAMRRTPMFAMAMDAADLNRDGWDDLFILDMLSKDRIHRLTTAPERNPPRPPIGVFDDRPEYMMNMLFLNRGDTTYAEVGHVAGVIASEWSWGLVCMDVDLDGWEDLLISNGNERESRHMDVAAQLKMLRTRQRLTSDQIFDNRRLFPRYATPNVAFKNRRDLTFEDASAEWGFDLAGVSHGILLADLDNDGDQDVVINNLNGPAALFRNNAPAGRIAVRLRGRGSNTAGIGARIEVRGGPARQSQEMIAGGRYLSSDQPLRVFAAGSGTNRLEVEVTWPSGRRSLVLGATANCQYEIAEPDAPNAAPAKRGASRSAPLFEDVSALLNHSHREESFDDFARQPTLPFKLSQGGPGVSWADVDGDGREDLVIPAARGGVTAVLRGLPGGRFEPWQHTALQRAAGRDQTTALAWKGASGKTELMMGQCGWEDTAGMVPPAERITLSGTQRPVLRPQQSSIGPLAMADIDGDGDLDLFAGGRCLPARYPEPAPSFVYLQDAHGFELDSENCRVFASIGMVSGATFADIDGDGDPDLALACDWGPVRLFRNDRGRFTDATASWGVIGCTGWWNGVVAADFDGDGRMDLAASNWGRNTRYQWHRSQPLQIYFTDWDGDGVTEMVEAHYDEGLRRQVPERGLGFLAKSFPFLQEKFPTHGAFAAAAVQDVLGPASSAMRVWEAQTLESTLFLNRSTQFVARPLPIEAQFAPAFGLCAGDFDGDGDDDLFLAQNFFSTQPESPRLDGGRGLWLRNDGRGGFEAVDGNESGVLVYGEQRGCAVADYDADGRLDLAVAQNGAATRLFHNRSANPGLRLRVQGPSANPMAIGARIRACWGQRLGPAREVRAGEGYWSQNSATLVLGGVQPPDRVQVRWPGGAMKDYPVPPGSREMVVSP